MIVGPSCDVECIAPLDSPFGLDGSFLFLIGRFRFFEDVDQVLSLSGCVRDWCIAGGRHI